MARQVSGASMDADGVVFIGGPRNGWRVDKLCTLNPRSSGTYGPTSVTWAGSSGEAAAAFMPQSIGLTPYFFDGQSWAAAPLPVAAVFNGYPVLGTAAATGRVLPVYLSDGNALYATWMQR